MTLEKAMKEIRRLYGTKLHPAMSQLEIKALYENYSYLDFDWGAMECSISFDTFRKAVKKLTD
jgi:hypothetical protein